VDVASKSLEARIGQQGAASSFINDPEGIAALGAFCLTYQVELVAMEATGGYEQQAFAQLSGQGLAVTILNPRAVRQFAQSMGSLEKTDAIDAGMIAWYAEVKKSQPVCLAPENQQHLRALVTRLRQLTEMRVVQLNQQRLVSDRKVQASFKKLLALLAHQIGELEKSIAVLLEKDPLWRELDQAFRTIKGVADRTVARLMAEMPEIGTLSNKTISKLAGLAPLAGPLANLATALVLAGAFMGASGGLNLFSQPWISSAWLVRSMVWMQAGLGLLHLLPASPLDGGRLLKGSFARKHGIAPTPRAAATFGQVLALAAMLGGMWLHSPWLIVAGFFIMIGAQIEDQGVFFQTVVDTVHMREVMLTDFATLSSSDTLADALVRCVHSLQEDFPVVRGANLVGIISRQRIVDALRNDGNGYVQGIMSKNFQVAQPEDTLGTTIRRLQTGHGLSLIPVTDSGRVVGIVSVQNLMSSMSLLAEQRRMERNEARG
jgi:transposase